MKTLIHKIFKYTVNKLKDESGFSLITKPNTFSSGATIVASEHNSNHDVIYDNYNGSITNVNIDPSAAIVGSKLDLSVPGIIGGTTPGPGTFTNLIATGTLAVTGNANMDGTVTLGNASGDDITIIGSIAASILLKDETIDIGTTSIGLNDLHFGSGGVINWDGGDITLTHAAGKLTFGGDGAVEIDFNNHEMTNVDIDSGAIDGTAIGAASATTIKGTTIEGTTSLKLATGATVTGIADEDDMTSDSATLLATQQSIKAYTDAAPNTSNVIFSWSGVDNRDANGRLGGIFVGDTLLPIIVSGGAEDGEALNMILVTDDTSSTRTLLNFQFTKIAGISTVTIHARLWAEDTGGVNEAILTVDIGGQNNTVKSVTSATPTWVAVATIDVSGLSNGTVYDGTVGLHNESGSKASYCSAVTLIAS